jgi:hypothetical protein
MGVPQGTEEVLVAALDLDTADFRRPDRVDQWISHSAIYIYALLRTLPRIPTDATA